MMMSSNPDRRTKISPINDQQMNELRATLGSDRLETLLSLLASEIPDRIEKVRCQNRDGNLSVIRSEAHNLKGMVASFGLQRVACAAEAVEFSHRGSEMNSALELLETEAQDALASLSQTARRTGKRLSRANGRP